MYPKISFITVVRNNAEGLRKTLRNLSEISYPNKELVVIDGLSTDGTVEVVAEFAHSISYFVSEADRGIYDAMNKGLDAATGVFVWFVNAADTVSGVAELKRLFTTDNLLPDIIYGDTAIESESGERLGLRRKPLPEELTVRSLRNGMVVCHQSMLVRRTIAPKYSLEYRYSSDYNWLIECTKAAKSTARIDGVLSTFALGGATTKHHKDSLRERFGIMSKHYGIVTTLLRHIKFIFDALFTAKYR